MLPACEGDTTPGDRDTGGGGEAAEEEAAAGATTLGGDEEAGTAVVEAAATEAAIEAAVAAVAAAAEFAWDGLPEGGSRAADGTESELAAVWFSVLMFGY